MMVYISVKIHNFRIAVFPLNMVIVGILLCCIFYGNCFSQENSVLQELGLRLSPVSYHMSFDNRDFFEEDFIEQSGKKSIQERKIDFPDGKFGKGIRMSFIPTPPDATNMSGIDLDLITAVLFNTQPGNTMGYNEPFIWGSGRINPRLGAVAFWAKGHLSLAGPLFEQTTISFGRKERELIGVTVDSSNRVSAYLRDARYVRHELDSDAVWDDSAWNHVVLNWDWANGLELWLNGKKIASSWGTDGWFETALPGLFHLPAPGIVYDELYLMDRPLSITEIKNLVSENIPPDEEEIVFSRNTYDSHRIAQYSGADRSEYLPVVSPDNALLFKEVWPTNASDGNVPGWHVIDGRNEMAWPHEYAFFTIIPGDGDYHAHKVDIKTPANSQVNYVTLTGNLTDVKVLAGSESMKDTEEVIHVPAGERFFYGSTITTTEGSTFRIPFTEKYGTPSDFNGDILLPLSGEKRIQEVGLYHVASSLTSTVVPLGDKLVLSASKPELNNRTQFAIHALTSRDERTIVQATNVAKGDQKIMDIGAFSRLNILSMPYEKSAGITEVTLSLPIKTYSSEEILFLRVRDPGVPSHLWNQFSVKLSGFERNFKKLILTIDFKDLVVAKGDRLWIDIGTSDKTEVLIGDTKNEAALFVSSVAPFLAIDDYVEKEIIPGKAQYSKQYEFMPWQFTGRKVSLDEPYCYGGSFDMLLPALAIHRVKPNDFVSNFLIEMCGPDYKDGKRREPQQTPLLTLTDPFGAPDWAIYMRDYNQKRWAIVDWWLKQQNQDGQIGGGWNDDTLFGNMGFEDLVHDGNNKFREFLNRVQTRIELTRLFKDGYCNIYPIDRMHTGDFISERYKTLIYNLGQAYCTEREMESAWRLGKPDKTPVNYYADGFKSSVNILNWYWGKDVPDAPYISKPLEDLTQDLRLFTSVLDSNNFYRMTESRVMADDFVPYGAQWGGGQNNIYTYMLGGLRGSRIDAHARLAVGWPAGGGPDVARLVMHADDISLNALVYSFDNKLRDLEMRLFRINDGRYKIGLYEDPDHKGEPDSAIWNREMNLSRFDVITLPIPPRKSLLIKVEQIKSYSRPTELPDLAIDPWDVQWDDNSLSATIHNLGNGKVDNVLVRLLDGEKVIEDQIISHLNAPTDFIAKKAVVSFNKVNYSRNLKIVIDPLNKIKEILKENNRTDVVSSVFESKDPIMWNIYQDKYNQAWMKLLADKDEINVFELNANK